MVASTNTALVVKEHGLSSLFLYECFCKLCPIYEKNKSQYTFISPFSMNMKILYFYLCFCHWGLVIICAKFAPIHIKIK